MKLGIPQFIVLAMLFINIGVALVTDGKPRTGKHSFMTTFISVVIQIWILYAGGFLSKKRTERCFF